MRNALMICLWKPQAFLIFYRARVKLNLQCRFSKIYDCNCCCRNKTPCCCLGDLVETWEGHNLSWPRCVVINPHHDTATDRLMCICPDIQMNSCRCRKVPANAHRHRGCDCVNAPSFIYPCICPAVTPQALLSSTLCGWINGSVVSLSLCWLFFFPLNNSSEMEPRHRSLTNTPQTAYALWREKRKREKPAVALHQECSTSCSLRPCICCSQ